MPVLYRFSRTLILTAFYFLADHHSLVKNKDPNEVKKYRHPEIETRTELSAFGYSVKPKEGNLLIFPSYLYHEVGKNLSDKDRIIISFNVEIKN